MKYCGNCGKACNDDVKFCSTCGYKFEEEVHDAEVLNNNVQSQNEYVQEQKGSLGKVSMILGIIGASLSAICICCLMPIGFILGPIALILGIVSVVKYPKHQKNMAVSGIILGSVAILISILVVVMTPQVLEMMKEMAREICAQDPTSDECQTYKNTFPNWFK